MSYRSAASTTLRSFFTNFRCNTTLQITRQPALQSSIPARRYFGDHNTNRYTATLKQLNIDTGVKCMHIGSEQKSSLHFGKGFDFLASVDPESSGSVIKALDTHYPYVTIINGNDETSGQAILDCIEKSVPIILVTEDGFPSSTQEKIAASLSEQSMSRIIGPGCKAFTYPYSDLSLSAEKLFPGRLGLISVGQSQQLQSVLEACKSQGIGQAALFDLTQAEGGTLTWELLQWMLSDSKADVICLLTDKPDQETAEAYSRYVSASADNQQTKSVFAMTIGDAETWQDAGIQVASSIDDVMKLISDKLGEIKEKKEATAEALGKSAKHVDISDVQPEPIKP